MENKTRLLLCALLLCVTAPAMAANRVSIAVVVGDDVITTSDIEERRDIIMATTGIAPTIENQQKLNARITQSLIDETLQIQEAKRNSITVTDEELNKAIDAMSVNKSGEHLRTFVKARGLSERSMESQVRAQLAWGKVVQRKLRRNVSIAQDEVLRAQRAQAAAPGEDELRITVLELPVAKGKEAAAEKLAVETIQQLKSGTDMLSIANRMGASAQYRPPVWVPENGLPPALAQTLRKAAAGEVAPPISMPGGIQILQVLERRTTPKQADTTEYALKQIAISAPKKRDKASLAKLESVMKALRANPGDCMAETLPPTDLPAEAKFIRARGDAMSPEQRSIVAHLEVGDISEPLIAPDAVRLVVMCEKIEPVTNGNLPDAEKVRQELFSDKLELEAQKHLRNLRRDAFIDIKGAP